MTHRERLWSNEQSVGSRLPYLAQIDDHTLLLRDHRLMQVLHLDGLLFETCDTEELNYRKELRASILRAVGSSRFSLYHHIVRRRAPASAAGGFPDPFSRTLDERWNARLSKKALFQNNLYLSLIRRPAQGKAGLAQWLGNFALGQRSQSDEAMRRELQSLVEAKDALVAALAPYGARCLGVYEQDGAVYSEPLEFLSLLLNGQAVARRLPKGEFAEAVGLRRISFGLQSAELGSFGLQAREAVGVISLKDYPGATAPGMLDELLRLPFEFIATQSFSFIDKAAASSRVNLSLRRMRAADDEAVSLRQELREATDDLAAGRAVYGEHHLTIALRAPTEALVADAVGEVQAALADVGMAAVREDIGLEPAFWAQFPGNNAYIARKALIDGRNFASLASHHNFPLGKESGNHWGPCVSLFETTAAGPYFFNFHQGDLGNFTIIGPSGTGKTVLLNFLIAQSLKFSPRIMFFDKDRGAEIFIRAIGGKYDVLRPGVPTNLNPLALAPTPANRRFLVEWLSTLLARGGDPLRPAELAHIEDAIEANFRAPKHLRRVEALADLLRGGDKPDDSDLYARLRPWFGKGEHAWLFDNPVDRLDVESRVIGFDMTRLLDEPALRTPTMMYLFHRVEERLDGAPSMIIIDEGWKALDDDIFVKRIRDWEKTIRKLNGLVGFVTQSAEDALASKISAAIVEQAATHIFLPNARAQERDYVGGFGLSAHEFDIVKTLPDHSHAFLIKRGRESVVARLDLAGEKDILAVLSGRESSVRLLDEIRAEFGDAPQDWMATFLERAS